MSDKTLSKSDCVDGYIVKTQDNFFFNFELDEPPVNRIFRKLRNIFKRKQICLFSENHFLLQNWWQQKYYLQWRKMDHHILLIKLEAQNLPFINGQCDSTFLDTEKQNRRTLAFSQKKTIFEQIKAKPKETLELEFTKSRESFSFDTLLGAQSGSSSHCDSSNHEDRWVMGISSLEVSISVSKKNRELETFEKTEIERWNRFQWPNKFFFQSFEKWWWEIRARRYKIWNKTTGCYWEIKTNGF